MLGLAALIGAVAFAALVLLLAVPLLKVGRTLDEATLTMRAARETPGTPAPAPVEIARLIVERSTPALAAPEPSTAVVTPPAIASAPLGAVVSSTLGDTLIKAAAYGHGVRTSVRKRLEPAPSRPVKRRR